MVNRKAIRAGRSRLPLLSCAFLDTRSLEMLTRVLMLSILNRAGRILVCFAALATVFTGCAPRGTRALLEGRDLIDEGRYAEAIEELRVATSLIRTNAQA